MNYAMTSGKPSKSPVKQLKDYVRVANKLRNKVGLGCRLESDDRVKK